MINNPQFFQDLVNRNPAILQQQQVRSVAECVNDLQRAVQTMQNTINELRNPHVNNRIDNNDNDGHDHNTRRFEIPLFGLDLQIDANRISFNQIQPENLFNDENEDANNQEDDVEIDEDVPDILVLEDFGLVMRVDANNITFSRTH